MAASGTLSKLDMRRLTGSIGAEVRNVDITHLDGDTFEALHQLFLEHLVLVFPEQTVSPEELLAFTKLWGDLYKYGDERTLEGYPDITTITNKAGKAGVKTEIWHSDHSTRPQPPAHAILSARLLPEVGGDTLWSNQYAAYDALSAPMKKLLVGLKGIHALDETRTAAHPVVRTHPETGRKCLYIRPLVRRFEGMTENESKGLIASLCEHAVSLEFVYRHRWSTGDVVMWDNRCTLHYAVHDYGDAPRTLYRTTVAGGTPE